VISYNPQHLIAQQSSMCCQRALFALLPSWGAVPGWFSARLLTVYSI
jgi:hypothetical protein